MVLSLVPRHEATPGPLRRSPWTSLLPVPTEAAFTLLLYCELLQWEERPLREFLHYPAQTEWQRKEGLCRKIIHYFNKGKVGVSRQTFQLFSVC